MFIFMCVLIIVIGVMLYPIIDIMTLPFRDVGDKEIL